jgi:hypothetical protein
VQGDRDLVSRVGLGCWIIAQEYRAFNIGWYKRDEVTHYEYASRFDVVIDLLQSYNRAITWNPWTLAVLDECQTPIVQQ